MKSIKAVIEKFGGLTEMSKKTGYLVPTLNNWNRSGFVPAKHQRAILDAAAKHKIKLKAEELIISVIDLPT